MRNYFLFLLFTLNFSLTFTTARAGLRVADIFSDHMVLQADEDVWIWGRADAGQDVSVTFADWKKSMAADTNGHWSLQLPPMPASLESRELHVVSGDEQVTFTDVLVGEVWFASGQSNMDWKLANSARDLPEIKALLEAADHPHLRYRAIKTRDQWEPQERIGDGKAWTVCTPETAKQYSAVAFLFARRLHEELKQPMGIIECAWGGHPIEPFIPREAFKGHPVLERIKALSDKKDLAGLKTLKGGVYARNASWTAGTIYNARIAPVIPYTLRGAIWYQAESNCGKEEDPRFYAEKMRALIRGWRNAWARPKLPVYFVQLPQFEAPGWVRMRDEQRRALDEPHTGMAVTIDLALDQIHPANKLDVAERLARFPLANEYGRDLVTRGPLYEDHGVLNNGRHWLIEFTGGPLSTGHKTDLQPTQLSNDKIVHGIELCGNDGVWHPAEATIYGKNFVRCSSEAVRLPQGIRYAWGTVMPKDRPWNLYNKAGLPASPFVSDTKWVPFDPMQPGE